MKDEEFIKGIYKDSEEELKEVYKDQKKNRDKILSYIAEIMLSYKIVDSIMELSNKEYSKEYKKITKVISAIFNSSIKSEQSKIQNILKNTAKKMDNHYDNSFSKKDMLKLVDQSFKGKHFSERVWENERAVAKKIQSEIKKFLKGEINVNKIKSNIVKQFNSNAYNTRRLVDTEVSRIINQIQDIKFKEMDVKRVKYNAILDIGTCEECASYHGKIFDVNKKPQNPAHPLCRCFYEVEE